MLIFAAKRFNAAMKTLGLSSAHCLHDLRKTFVSLAKYYGVDEYAIKKVIGHKISDLTEAVCTTRPDDWLFKEMKKIKGIADLTT